MEGDEPKLFVLLIERRMTIRSLWVLRLESTGHGGILEAGYIQSAVLISRA